MTEPELRNWGKRYLLQIRNFVSSYALVRVQSHARKRGQRTIVVVGARRSGHHAVLAWLVNSLEGSPVEWDRVGPSQCYISSSRRTAHLNNWKVDRSLYKSWQSLRLRHQFRSADHLIVSFEDVDPLILDRHMWFPTRPELKIVVRRSTLNVVASRLKKAEEKLNSRDFDVDEQFLNVMLSYRSVLPGWLVIDFDTWLRNEDGYRSSIAERAGLDSGDDPDLSSHGGGSSFSGLANLPAISELTNRFTQVQWPERIVKLLLNERYSTLLTREERDFLETRGG